MLLLAERGEIGQRYCIGGNCEKTNKDLLNHICNLLDIYCPKSYKHNKLIKNVKDRPGHDKRYSIDTTKITTGLDGEENILLNKVLKIQLNGI